MHDAGFTATEMKAAGYTATEMKNIGWTLAELREGGYTLMELKDLYNLQEIHDAGFTVSEHNEQLRLLNLQGGWQYVFHNDIDAFQAINLYDYIKENRNDN